MQKGVTRKAVTAKDVAEACGVSQATVSYVINNSAGGRISEATRLRVLEVSRQMGYCPSQSALSMRMSRAMAVGVVLGGNSLSLGVSHALRGIKRRMDAAGYAQVLLSDEDDVLPGVDYLSQYRAGRIDALLFLFHEMPDELVNELRAQNVPYLALSEQGITGESLSLSSGYTDALDDCARMMRERALTRVHYYSFQHGETLHSRKFNMFRAALMKECPEAQLERVVLRTDRMSDEQLLDALYGDICTGGFDIAVTPHARLGWMVQNAILRKRLAVPQDVKHLCLSTAHPFSLVYPSITMIDIPLTQLGDVAAQHMLNMIAPAGAARQEADAPPEMPKCCLRPGMSTM